MITLTFEKYINAPAQKVWQVLWNEDSYRQWTEAFMPGSRMVSDWKPGGKTYFLSPEDDGMVATIESLNEPYEVVFRQLGEVNKGVEDTTSEKVQAYNGSYEKYFLTEVGGQTRLVGTVDTLEEYKHIMERGFTQGFEIVKRLSENN